MRRSTDEIAEIVEIARSILAEGKPMSLRQVFYQLVARQVLQNTQTQYKRLSDYLVDARKDGRIPWAWVEDRTRFPRRVPQWDDLAHFADAASTSYRRNVWDTQPHYVEAWCEKDALSGIFQQELRRYGVTLNVGRGYDGWSSIYGAAMRYADYDDRTSIILYFGDFDPSGLDIGRSLTERLGELTDCEIDVVRCALTLEDVERHKLPPQMSKTSDSRAAKHIAKYGKMSSVELDALPANVLRERIRNEVESYMDMEALARVKVTEGHERELLVEALQGIA